MANTQMGLIGRKLGMTQVYDDAGNVAGVTVVEVAPNLVMQVKSPKGKDGYAAIQLGAGSRREKRTSKAEIGHAKKAGSTPLRFVREIRLAAGSEGSYEQGKSIDVGAVFKDHDIVDVRGTSKGRGFAGVMKRHNFPGFKRTHGAHEYKRHGGSIGTRLTPGMTKKGMKMPGHMGNANVSVQNMEVLKVDAEKGLLFIRGGVPGPRGAWLIVRKAVKP